VSPPVRKKMTWAGADDKNSRAASIRKAKGRRGRGGGRAAVPFHLGVLVVLTPTKSKSVTGEMLGKSKITSSMTSFEKDSGKERRHK
jgi:hypothetical protein